MLKTKKNRVSNTNSTCLIGRHFTFNLRGTIIEGVICSSIPNNIHKNMYLFLEEGGKEYLVLHKNNKVKLLGLFNPYYQY